MGTCMPGTSLAHGFGRTMHQYSCALTQRQDAWALGKGGLKILLASWTDRTLSNALLGGDCDHCLCPTLNVVDVNIAERTEQLGKKRCCCVAGRRIKTSQSYGNRKAPRSSLLGRRNSSAMSCCPSCFSRIQDTGGNQSSLSESSRSVGACRGLEATESC